MHIFILFLLCPSNRAAFCPQGGCLFLACQRIPKVSFPCSLCPQKMCSFSLPKDPVVFCHTVFAQRGCVFSSYHRVTISSAVVFPCGFYLQEMYIFIPQRLKSRHWLSICSMRISTEFWSGLKGYLRGCLRGRSGGRLRERSMAGECKL